MAQRSFWYSIIVSFLVAAVTGDAFVSDAISAGNCCGHCVCKSHAIQDVHLSTKVVLQGSVLLQGLVVHQDTRSGHQVGWVLVIAKGILVFKGGPKHSISASVSPLQER